MAYQYDFLVLVATTLFKSLYTSNTNLQRKMSLNITRIISNKDQEKMVKLCTLYKQSKVRYVSNYLKRSKNWVNQKQAACTKKPPSCNREKEDSGGSSRAQGTKKNKEGNIFLDRKCNSKKSISHQILRTRAIKRLNISEDGGQDK